MSSTISHVSSYTSHVYRRRYLYISSCVFHSSGEQLLALLARSRPEPVLYGALLPSHSCLVSKSEPKILGLLSFLSSPVTGKCYRRCVVVRRSYPISAMISEWRLGFSPEPACRLLVFFSLANVLSSLPLSCLGAS